MIYAIDEKRENRIQITGELFFSYLGSQLY